MATRWDDPWGLRSMHAAHCWWRMTLATPSGGSLHRHRNSDGENEHGGQPKTAVRLHWSIDLLGDACLQNWCLLEVVNLLNPVQIFLRRFLPAGFSRNKAVVTPDTFRDSEALDVVLQDARTEIDVVFNLEKVDILAIRHVAPRRQMNLHDAHGILP